MTKFQGLLEMEDIKVATAGVPLLADALSDQLVALTRVDWRPAVPGSQAALDRVMADVRRTSANSLALTRMLATGAQLVDVRQASEALNLETRTFLHAGPPLTWENASGPMRGALIGGVIFEGYADNPEAAEKLLASGGIKWEPCHHRNAVGPMAGVVTPSMWMFELLDPSTGNHSWCSLNEGLGKVLRYGAYSDDVIVRLQWMTEVLGPLLKTAVKRRNASAAGPVDVKAILSQMIQMGDEGHNRNRAGTLMLIRDLLPDMIESGASTTDLATATRFIGGNDHFFLNLAMPACKLQTMAARDIPGSSVVTVMARNGTDFGIQVSGTGDKWFTAPADTPVGLFLGSYTEADANPDIGDSAIAETAGIGGFSMAAAPAIVRFVGGSVPDALAATRRMYEITVGENQSFGIPVLEFRGAPTGIDVTRVIRTGILPQINTGMAGRLAGIGQVGAGLVNPPMACFEGAITGLAEASPQVG
ncbi:MAG TPA: DUF1116 domain-containing protein [Candidatus Nanopelagicaceae bacterium]|nr:DUF1116 domain-containing protein [Candidatus Nanopelagicaceae bacterium]